MMKIAVSAPRSGIDRDAKRTATPPQSGKQGS